MVLMNVRPKQFFFTKYVKIEKCACCIPKTRKLFNIPQKYYISSIGHLYIIVFISETDSQIK